MEEVRVVSRMAVVIIGMKWRRGGGHMVIKMRCKKKKGREQKEI